MTLGDKIRSLSDERLACVLYQFMASYVMAFVEKNRKHIYGNLRPPSDEQKEEIIRDLLEELRTEFQEGTHGK